MPQSSTEDEKVVGKEAYRKFLRIIRHQCGSPQHPMVDVSGVRTIFIGYTNHDPEAYTKALSMAVQKDHIVKWTDTGEWTGGNVRTRLALTPAGVDEIRSTYPYDEDDIECIKRIRTIQVERVDAEKEGEPKPIVGWANQHLDEIEKRITDGSQSGTDSEEENSSDT